MKPVKNRLKIRLNLTVRYTIAYNLELSVALKGGTMRRSLLGCDKSVVWYIFINFCMKLPPPSSRYKIKEVGSSILMPDYMVTYIRRQSSCFYRKLCLKNGNAYITSIFYSASVTADTKKH